MLTKTISILLVALSVMTGALAIPSPRLPLPTPAHVEPNILSDYERTVVTLEMQNLTREIGLARKKTAKDPSLDDAKKELEEARESKDAKQLLDAKRKLNDMIETILYKQEDMPAKTKRLLEVGKLLEFDTQKQKEIRRRKGTAFQ